MKQVCVIGIGQFGAHLARTLVKMRCEVLAIDLREDRVDAVRDDVHRALIGDARSFQTLQSVLTSSVEEAVVALGEDSLEPSILCTLNLSRLNVPSIRCTAVSEDHAQILRAVGATDVIFPEQESAARTARRVADPNLRDMFSLAEDFRIMELAAPRQLQGKTLGEMDLRQEYDVLILAVKPPGEEEAWRFLPSAQTVVQPGEAMMVLGRELDIARLAGLD